MDPFWVLTIVCGLIVLLLMIGAPLRPLRWIGQGAIKLVIGALLLFFMNAFGTAINLHVPINLITASVSGFLGIPGLLALVAIQKIIL
ncbi:pro-sigmaK processing inhibitor BofA family protein [Alkalihalobacillus sp. AL-G]|uniref:pro-sigmaK processing inhibitor BofA family protein n=1 Tax=Alkalihalobacillus sp. AL-G TaxID=2926399 RepID=UPI00272C6123|nr:pro-sigmaK processing inhibitor BofA family protein [Alkalihalobacillus sp. AL-G]WLD93438.1 pro-sigmaK processing inhibitor BofA family protein [Alkalihalobacillus sp. AL-G]